MGKAETRHSMQRLKKAEPASTVSQPHSSARGPSRVIQAIQANPEPGFPLVVINRT